MDILSGKEVAAAIKGELKAQVDNIVASGAKRPCLTAILVGNDGASLTYVGHKERTCKEIGIESILHHLDESISQNKLISLIQEINQDPKVDGLIVQLPLPKHIDESAVISAIDPAKDVDGFHVETVGKMISGLDSYLPATPAGILDMLDYYKIETAGKHCVVIGRSHIVGRPIANLLSQKRYPGDCTVTMCHSRTKDLKSFTLMADILIVAIGAPLFIKADMIKEGATVIDVGIHRIADSTRKTGYKIVGDVDTEGLEDMKGAITPVPGGVGVMTIISLMKNTLLASKLQR